MAKTAQGVKEFLNDNDAVDRTLTTSQKGAVTGTLNKYLGGDANRKVVLSWLFSEDGKLKFISSSKELKDYQWVALYDWCGFYQEDGRWYPQMDFALESCYVLSAAMKAFGTNKIDIPDGIPEVVMEAVTNFSAWVTNITDEEGNWLIDKKADKSENKDRDVSTDEPTCPDRDEIQDNPIENNRDKTKDDTNTNNRKKFSSFSF